MTRVIADTGLSAKVRAAGDMLEVCDESGRVIGYYQPALTTRSPFSREELERRRREEGGSTLEEIMGELRA